MHWRIRLAAADPQRCRPVSASQAKPHEYTAFSGPLWLREARDVSVLRERNSARPRLSDRRDSRGRRRMSDETADPTEPEPGDVSPTGGHGRPFRRRLRDKLLAENAERPHEREGR